MKYLIDNTEVSKDEFMSELEDCFRCDAEESFREALNEQYPDLCINGYDYAGIYEKLDPIAYGIDLDSYLDSDLEDLKDSFDECENDAKYNATYFETVEDEEE